MLAVLACAFPLLVIASLLTLLPVRLSDSDAERDRQRDDESRDRSLVSLKEHFAANLPYAAAFLVFGALLGFAQHRLFVVVRAEKALFSHRLADMLVYAMLPSLFLGIVVAYPVCFRLLYWWYGDRIVDLLDRRARGRAPMSARETMRIFPALAWSVAIAATVMNLAATNTFLEITTSSIRYSGFFSPITHERRLGDIEQVVLYSRRRAPNGTVNRRRSLDIQFKDGTVLDTFHTIEAKHIPVVLSVLRGTPAFTGAIVESADVKR